MQNENVWGEKFFVFSLIWFVARRLLNPAICNLQVSRQTYLKIRFIQQVTACWQMLDTGMRNQHILTQLYPYKISGISAANNTRKAGHFHPSRSLAR